MPSVSARPAVGFALGDVLVDPRHGVVVVDGFETRPHAGKPLAYIRLRALNGLTILLPAEGVARVGLRRPMRIGQTERVFGLLASAPEPIPPWRHSEFTALRRRVESGDPLEVASVMRDLHGKEHTKGLGGSEKALLEETTEILVTELALVLRMSREAATQRIADALENRA